MDHRDVRIRESREFAIGGKTYHVTYTLVRHIERDGNYGRVWSFVADEWIEGLEVAFFSDGGYESMPIKDKEILEKIESMLI